MAKRKAEGVQLFEIRRTGQGFSIGMSAKAVPSTVTPWSISYGVSARIRDKEVGPIEHDRGGKLDFDGDSCRMRVAFAQRDPGD